MTAPLLPGAGNESIYAAILARLDAHELQQHYAPLFRGRLELARDTLTDAVAALQQLQEIHASVKALGHPQSNTVTRSTAPFMPLADQIVDAQQHLIQAIVESLEESESATAAPTHMPEQWADDAAHEPSADHATLSRAHKRLRTGELSSAQHKRVSLRIDTLSTPQTASPLSPLPEPQFEPQPQAPELEPVPEYEFGAEAPQYDSQTDTDVSTPPSSPRPVSSAVASPNATTPPPTEPDAVAAAELHAEAADEAESHEAPSAVEAAPQPVSPPVADAPSANEVAQVEPTTDDPTPSDAVATAPTSGESEAVAAPSAPETSLQPPAPSASVHEQASTQEATEAVEPPPQVAPAAPVPEAPTPPTVPLQPAPAPAADASATSEQSTRTPPAPLTHEERASLAVDFRHASAMLSECAKEWANRTANGAVVNPKDTFELTSKCASAVLLVLGYLADVAASNADGSGKKFPTEMLKSVGHAIDCIVALLVEQFVATPDNSPLVLELSYVAIELGRLLRACEDVHVRASVLPVFTRLNTLERNGKITLYSEDAVRGWWKFATTTCATIVSRLRDKDIGDSTEDKRTHLDRLLHQLTGVLDQIARRGRSAIYFLSLTEQKLLREAVETAVETAIALKLPLSEMKVLLERIESVVAHANAFSVMLQALVSKLRTHVDPGAVEAEMSVPRPRLRRHVPPPPLVLVTRPMRSRSQVRELQRTLKMALRVTKAWDPSVQQPFPLKAFDNVLATLSSALDVESATWDPWRDPTVRECVLSLIGWLPSIRDEDVRKPREETLAKLRARMSVSPSDAIVMV